MKAEREGLLAQEFADLFHVSKDTLLYYDKIGLFCPSLVAENGYRIYSLDQVHIFDLLLLLRDSRLPLKQIKKYLQHRNSEEMLNLLRKQSRSLKEEILQLQKLCQRLDFTALQIERGMEPDLGAPTIQMREEARYVVISVASETVRNRKSRMTAVRKFWHHCQVKGLREDYLRCAVITKDHLLQKCYDKEFFCIRTGASSEDELDTSDVLLIRQPRGTYAVMRHHDSYDKLPLSYEKLMSYVREQGWTVCGNAYETELIGGICEQSDLNYVIEIAIEVTR